MSVAMGYVIVVKGKLGRWRNQDGISVVDQALNGFAEKFSPGLRPFVA